MGGAHGSPCHSELRVPTAPSSQMEFDGKESLVGAGAREELRLGKEVSEVPRYDKAPYSIPCNEISLEL